MLKSRRIYAEKLLKTYPDNIEFGIYYIRDCIAPRFYIIAKQEYGRGIRIKNIELCYESLEDLLKYAKYFNIGWIEKIKNLIMKSPRLMFLLYSMKTKYGRLKFDSINVNDKQVS